VADDQPDDDDSLDYHDPTAGLGGAPPARSALGLRLALASFGLLACIALTVGFAVTGRPAVAGVAAALAAVAAVDIVVVVGRMRSERRRHGSAQKPTL
jgi:hypothetical protein